MGFGFLKMFNIIFKNKDSEKTLLPKLMIYDHSNCYYTCSIKLMKLCFHGRFS